MTRRWFGLFDVPEGLLELLEKNGAREIGPRDCDLITSGLLQMDRRGYSEGLCATMDELTDLFDTRADCKKQWDGPMRPVGVK